MNCRAVSLAGLLCAVGVPMAEATIHYVNWTNLAPTWPYTNMQHAARNIQDAVRAASAGSTVLVAAGYYSTGGVVSHGLTNRVWINRPLTLRSLAGPDQTFIVGNSSTGLYRCGAGAVRCLAVVTSPVVVVGFTLTNGHTHTTGDVLMAKCGGGVLAVPPHHPSILHCTIRQCGASYAGGGGYGGFYSNTVIRQCLAWMGGGLYQAEVRDSYIEDNRAGSMGGGLCLCTGAQVTVAYNATQGSGGGTSVSLLQRSLLAKNSAYYGGGDERSQLTSCVLFNNTALREGGGVTRSRLLNCTVFMNWAQNQGGGGSAESRFTNCIVFNNWAASNANVDATCTGRYNCVYAPAVSWRDTWGLDPRLSWVETTTPLGHYQLRVHLRGSSPCINAGTNLPGLASARDFSGRRRILYDRVDLGAHEYAAVVSDYDGDGVSDFAVYEEGDFRWAMRAWLSASGTLQRWHPRSPPRGLVPVPGDYDGDGQMDVMGYQESTGAWYEYPFTTAFAVWGGPRQAPVWGDFDGDGPWEMAVYHLDTGRWSVRKRAGAILAQGLPWGYAGAVPVPGDYDGDGAFDLAVYDRQSGRWYIRTLNGTVIAWNLSWGYAGTLPVSGDFDGDGLFDLAVYDPGVGTWYVRSLVEPSPLWWNRSWGYPGAFPVPGDFDGDGEYDAAVFDGNTGRWYVTPLRSSPLYWNTGTRCGVAIPWVRW